MVNERAVRILLKCILVFVLLLVLPVNAASCGTNALFCYYYPPTKLREGYVFSRACLSVHSGVFNVAITHDALDLTYRTPLFTGP